jgi:hypothetical protein
MRKMRERRKRRRRFRGPIGASHGPTRKAFNVDEACP